MATAIDCPPTPRIYYDDSDTEQSISDTESTIDYNNDSPTPQLYEDDYEFMQLDAIDLAYDDSMDYRNYNPRPDTFVHHNFVQNRGIREVLICQFGYGSTKIEIAKDALKRLCTFFLQQSPESVLSSLEHTTLYRHPIKPFPKLDNFDYYNFYMGLIRMVYNALYYDLKYPDHMISHECNTTHYGNLRVKPENKSEVLTAPGSLFTMIQLKRTCRLFYDIIKSVSHECKSCAMPYLSSEGWNGGLKKPEIPACPNCCQMEPDWWVSYKLNPMTLSEYLKNNQFDGYYHVWDLEYGANKDVYYLDKPIVDTSKFKRGLFLPKDRDDFVKYGQGFLVK